MWSNGQRNQPQQPQPDVTEDNPYDDATAVPVGSKPDIIYAHIDPDSQSGDDNVVIPPAPPKVMPNEDAVIYSELLNADNLYDN